MSLSRARQVSDAGAGLRPLAFQRFIGARIQSFDSRRARFASRVRPSGARLATLPPRSKRLRPIDYLYRGLRRNPDAIAIGGPGDATSYAELVAAVEALAA